MKPVKIVDGITLICSGTWHNMPALSPVGGSNSYLIDGGSELALVDVGYPETVPYLLKNVKAAGFNPKKIRKVFLTHAHDDHTAGVSELLKHIDAAVYAHPLCKETLGAGPGIYNTDFRPVKLIKAPVHETLKEGDNFKVGRWDFKVMELPGHTPDSLGLLTTIPEGLACFSGDMVDGDQPIKTGVCAWMDGHWGSKVTHMRASLARLLSLGLAKFFPGHGNAQTTHVMVRDSLEHSLAAIHRLLAVPDLDWLICIQV